MKSFYINPKTNDLEFDGSNNLRMVDDDAELVQSVRLRIATNVNEWFLNKSFGFDRSAIMGKRINYEIAIDTLYDCILQDSRIKSINQIDFNYDRESRAFEINFSFEKADGGTLEGSVSV